MLPKPRAKPAWPSSLFGARHGSRLTATAGPKSTTARPRSAPSVRKRAVSLSRLAATTLRLSPKLRSIFYLFRSVDPIDPPLPLPHASYITARGPFSEADDRALMKAHGIEAVIAKNSGGNAAYGKIAAARDLGIEVILVRRPAISAAPAVETIDAAMAWLDHALTSAAARGV